MNARLFHTATALPPYRHSQQTLTRLVQEALADRPTQAARVAAIFANAQVSQRYSVRPAEWYLAHQGVEERSEVYGQEMVALCEQAARQVLSESGVAAEAIGMIITTSCTGLMIPPVESHLMNRMPFSPQVRRLPLTELGCAAGASALAQAALYLEARPEEAVLVLSAELASLTLQVRDFSMANLVSSALFGDGAAAVLVTGEGFSGPAAEVPPPQGAPPPRVLAVRSVQFPDTLEMMGFDNTDTGLRIFLSPRVPRLVREQLPPALAVFLEEQGLALEHLTHFLLHPGGPKVIDGLERKLNLSPRQTALSREVMRDHGNLSSATVLFLLDAFRRQGRPQPGELGLLLAVGPGFAAEMVLLRW